MPDAMEPRRPDSGNPDQEPPQYTLYRAKPRLFRRARAEGSPLDELRGAPGEAPGRRRRFKGPITAGRAFKWLALGALAWIALSIVLFFLSAQFEQEKVSQDAEAQLSGSGFPLTSANTILVLGSDQRTKGTKEPGASTEGPSRSDSIMLMRVGGGHHGRLSILRDTVVDIPGHGRNKINAAYAIGGAALAIQTIKQYLDIPIDHVVEINFDRFPDLIDAMGGITYKGGCVVSKINGGFKNGGYTLRLKRGSHHIDGKQALALARTRHNLCNLKEDDRTRARRQQKIFSAMKSRLLSPFAFIRLPLISWNAPKTLRSDMSGPTLAGLFGALAIGGSPPTRVLRPSGATTLPDGGAGLTVSDETKRRAVRRFLDG